VRQPELFDEAEELTAPSAERSTWQEIPAARFLSWTRREQLAYCAARDEDAALYCVPPEDPEWYRQRARSYREMMR